MRRGLWGSVAAAAMGAAVIVGVGPAGPPASADYAPFVVIDPTSGAGGTVVSASSDFSGGCGGTRPGAPPSGVAPGTASVAFGTLDQLPPIGGPVSLGQTLVSTEVQATDDGSWSTAITVPDGLAPGTYYVAATCSIPDDSDPPVLTRSFDYYPAAFELTAPTTTTTVAPPTTVPPAPPAPSVSGTADFTG